jgi:ankyrin repeat protein
MARALLDAGAPVEGDPSDPETPLMTAASYGDAEVAQVLIEAGADLDATVSGTKDRALRQAVVCGKDDVVRVLLAAGATDLVQAAAAGDITGMLSGETPQRDLVAALRIGAGHSRLEVIARPRCRRTHDGVESRVAT